jgi:hypothetical protein
MRISIEKIDAEEIAEVNSSTSVMIVGGKSQFADISVSASTGSSYAGASITARNQGTNPFLEFSTSINALNINGISYSSSSTYVRAGSS